jgi:hypothetical protein
LLVDLFSLKNYCIIYCIIKDEKWYADEVSDTTTMTIAASLPTKKAIIFFEKKLMALKKL